MRDSKLTRITDEGEFHKYRAVTYQIDRWLTIKIDECIDDTGSVGYSGINPDNIRGPWITREYKTADYKAGLKMAASYIRRKGWKVTSIEVRSGWYERDWAEPKKVRTEDGYTFHRQADRTYTDHEDPDQADVTFDSYQDLKNYATS